MLSAKPKYLVKKVTHHDRYAFNIAAGKIKFIFR